MSTEEVERLRESGKEVRTLTVNSAMLAEAPQTVGELLARHVAKHPDAFWIVLIGDREDARTFMETQLWHMRPEESIT